MRWLHKLPQYLVAILHSCGLYTPYVLSSAYRCSMVTGPLTLEHCTVGLGMECETVTVSLNGGGEGFRDVMCVQHFRVVIFVQVYVRLSFVPFLLVYLI